MNETWSYTLRGLQHKGVPNIPRGQCPLKTHAEAYPNVLYPFKVQADGHTWPSTEPVAEE